MFGSAVELTSFATLSETAESVSAIALLVTKDESRSKLSAISAKLAPGSMPSIWISSINKNGVANLAPYSYFNAVADDPPQVMFCANGSSVPVSYTHLTLPTICSV